jgi:ATP-dependent Clp protease adapter protein ClpS
MRVVEKKKKTKQKKQKNKKQKTTLYPSFNVMCQADEISPMGFGGTKERKKT